MPETTPPKTNNQKMAQAAYDRIIDRQRSKEYASFARSFPSLIHSCGLAQAVAFAMAKEHKDYAGDLADILKAAGHPEAASADALDKTARTTPVAAYVRLSRNALQAAGWLKRYVEALAPSEEK